MGIRGRSLEPEETNLEAISYRGSGATEHFLSCKAADSGALIGYARLRCADDPKSHPARVRELHVYGELTPFDSDTPNGWQHRGTGELLLSRCEELSAESDHDTISVTSGVGAREYYRRLGYERNGMYMEKTLCR